MGGRRLTLLVRLHVSLAMMTSGLFPLPGAHCVAIKRRYMGHDENQILKAADADKSMESIYYDRADVPSNGHRRPGEPTESSSCPVVRPVPEDLRSSHFMWPNGLSREFYEKYTEAYGIPVVGSADVPDSALSRACYVLRFLLSDRADLRRAYYKLYGRVAVIGRHQTLHDIPEYHYLGVDELPFPADGPLPVRGLGAVTLAPVTTAPEENLLCYDGEPRGLDDVLLKTLSIGLLNLAATGVDPQLKDELTAIYTHAVRSGWWRNTNAARGPESYFGEGVQSFFNANAYAYPPSGYHNHINTRTKLRNYDTSLYAFVQNMFPCANNYIKRCNNRGNEAYQTLAMDCPQSGWFSYRRHTT